SLLEIIKKYDMILATGHLSPAESIRLIEKAHDSGLRKFIITHPDSPTTFFDLDQQKYLGRFGVFFERSYRIPAINFTTWDYFISEIKYTGPSRNVLATDLGQLDSPYPAEGMKELVKKLLENGFSLEEVRRMCVENYVFLLGRRGHN
ncbi:MAG TPA: DUF6282 family protein, partial [Thermoplasmataceae archaeon]|nr:DUF6282 family protein [Thermoplasmataceae archaeon]